MFQKYLVSGLALFGMLLCIAAGALAGPAYRVARTSLPEEDNWRQAEGLSIRFDVDVDRCKKEYGANWSRQCSGPPAGQYATLVEGVRMTPATPGEWRWLNGSSMAFTPEKHLHPQTTYTISLEKVSLPSRFSVNRQLTYTTQPQAARIGKETFWTDPSAKAAHAISVPVYFIWPVNPQDMEKDISLRASNAKSGLSFGTPRFIWNEKCTEVVVSVPVMSLPGENSSAVLRVQGLPDFIEKNGKRTVRPGKANRENVEALFAVVGRDRIMNVQSVTVKTAYGRSLEKEYHLIVKTSLRMLPSELLHHLEVIQLPEKITPEAGQEADWTKMPAISANDIKRGKKLQPDLLQPADEASDTIALRIPAGAGRGLLASVKKGLISIGGMSLTEARRFILTTPPLGAELNFLQPGNIVTLSGDKKLDIYAVGLTGIQWRAERVRDPFLALLAKDSGFEENTADFTVMSDAVQGHLDMRGFGAAKAPGESFFGVLDLAPLLRGPDGPKHGLMRMTVTGHNADRQVAEVSRLLLVTDMGLNVKTASDGTRAVFVQNLATGKSVANAEVRLLGANGLPVCSAFTNAQGRADLPSAVGLEREKRPVAVVALAAASGGQDMAWLSLDDNARNVDYSNFSVSGRHAAGNGLIASAFSQRGLYLPGEKLHFGCIVRRFDWQPLPAELPLEAVLVSPTGAEVMRRPFTLGAEGLQNFAWNSTEDAAVGQYRLDIRLASGKPGSGSSGPVLGGTSTRIEEFQPDTLALSTSFEPGIPKGWIRTGVGASPAVAVARLDNLYGEPAANHRIRTAFHARKGMLRFPGYEEYVFYDASPSGAQDQYMDLPDAFTSSKGIARLPLPLDRLQGNTFYGTLMIDGFEPEGGRAVTRQMSALFSPLEVALGYKGEEQANNLEYVPQHSRALLRLVAVNNDLAPVALRGAEIVFSTRRYVNSLVTDARGEYYYDATPVDTEIKRQTVNLEPQGLSWAMPTSEAGDFLVTVRQANGSILALIPYSVAGDRLADPAGLSTGSLAKGNLRLKLEKEHYQPGETIKMRLSTPYSGTGLITIERENVLTHAWFTAQAGESVQEIQIPEQFEGRGYVNVSFVRSLDSEAVYMNPHTYGMAPFTVGMSRRDMGLKITAPERVLPGEKVTVRLTSRVPGKAVLFAVDEGVLQITGFATPDPLRELLGDRALDVSTMQAFDLLMPDHARLQGRIPGFGGDMAGAGGRFLNPFKRRGEPPFAFWQEVSAVSAEGTEISFDVPAYVSGRIRIMAVGSTSVHDGRSTAGSARADMEVRGSLILKPLLPLAVVPGDEFDAALVIANTVEGSGKDARVAVTMECGPELVFLNGQKPQPIAVNENGEAVLHFRMRAQDVLGSAEVRFTASLEGKEKAGSSTRRQSLSVRPPAPRVRTEQVVALAGDMDVPVNRDLYPYEAQGQATVSALPVLGLRSLLARLDTYPYGCTEQLISRAMPYVALLAAPELRKQALSSPRTSSETLAKRGNAVISAALDTIRSNFRYYEGVSLWPASSANDFVTAYAGDFLLTLRESGVVAPEGLTRNILDSLENTVRRSPVDANDGRIKVYGAWVLLRDGRIMTQEVERLEQWFKENTDGWERDLVAVLLADCYDMLRLKRRAEQLMPSAFVAATGDSMLGQGAAAALHATVVLRHFPEKRQQVNTDVLLDEAFNTAATTVDMGLISRALVMLAGQEASPPEGISLTCTSYAQGFSALEPQDSMRASVLTLDAPGCLNYRASVPRGDKGWNLHVAAEGFERKPLTPASNGLELQRRYVNSNGEAVTSARLGDVLTVELSLRSPAAYANVVVVDLLPGGFEAVLEKSGATESQEGLIRHERREDRGIFFVNTGPQVRTFTYKVRAATRGRFVLPSAMAEAMYEPATNARLGGGYVNIE